MAAEHIAAQRAADAEDIEADIEIVLGQSNQAPRAPTQITAYADGWRLFVGRQEAVPREALGSALPFGPYLAACFAAGEVFKHLRGLRANKGTFLGPDKDLIISAWTCETAPEWHELAPDRGHFFPTPPHRISFSTSGAMPSAAPSAASTTTR